MHLFVHWIGNVFGDLNVFADRHCMGVCVGVGVTAFTLAMTSIDSLDAVVGDVNGAGVMTAQIVAIRWLETGSVVHLAGVTADAGSRRSVAR